MSYTICAKGIGSPKEYLTEDQARKGAIALTKKKEVTYVNIFETSKWKSIIHAGDEMYKHAIGYVYPPMRVLKESNPMNDNYTYMLNGLEKGYTLNADGSLGRPFKMLKSGEVKYTDVPKKKKKDTGMHPFGL